MAVAMSADNVPIEVIRISGNERGGVALVAAHPRCNSDTDVAS